MGEKSSVGLIGQAPIRRAWRGLFIEHRPEALDELRNLAEQGSSLSMIHIGLAYEQGTCVKKNFVEAEKWFQRAADAGSLRGYYFLGRLYLDTKQYKEAEKAFALATEKHHPQSLYQLGRMYMISNGVKFDAVKARHFLERSFALGDIYAKRDLGLLLVVVGKDRQERWNGFKMYFSARKQIKRRKKRFRERYPTVEWR